MLQKLLGLLVIVVGALLTLAGHWIVGVLAVVFGVLVVNSARRGTFVADTGSGYDGGSSWSTTSSASGSDWNASSDGNRDCGSNDGDNGGGDCSADSGGSDGGGDGGGGGD
ncbi:hypothetical protein LVB77_10275 [Lysobacter sp. 5GHs7-4]|uniref:hypothetical protein n=1 Tax=Lysobacter sp. 5GHs7-4 TaxID=2904253 RepID=UPI001E4E62B6|nr:hypothetical protein [Lysobacter sp. 5GHs7-4]UHQ25027.1 hypothetical protein LVB77_10275 [Lysobacter sp. 5GHs7-4]